MSPKEKIVEIGEKIDKLIAARDGYFAEWAKDCPHTVGDCIEVPKGAWANVGKLMRVDDVITRKRYFGYEWLVSGTLFKKGGVELSLRDAEFSMRIAKDAL